MIGLRIVARYTALAVGFPLIVAGQNTRKPQTVIHVGPNIRASENLKTGWRNEVWLAASTTDPKVLVGTSHFDEAPTRLPTSKSNGCVVYVSRDGGARWKELKLDPGPGCFDAMTAGGPDGRMYALGARVQGTPNFGLRSQPPLGVWRSVDSGKTWQGPVLLRAPLGADHPRLGVDNSSSPHRGNVYVIWNEGNDSWFKNKYHVFFHRSTDGGATFSDPIIFDVDSGGKLVTTEPLVLTDGTLLLTHYQYYQPLSGRKNEHQPVYLFRSTDGGKSFGPREKIGEVGIAPHRGRRLQTFTLPILTADASPTSPYRDRLYMVWDDANTGESNVWISWSGDKGKTWSARKKINDNVPSTKGAPLDLRSTPTVAVNKDGVVGVAWYDRREDPTRRCWRYYFAASLDGGETFLPNTAVSSKASCPHEAKAPTIAVANAAPDTAIPPMSAIDSLMRAGKTGEAYALNEEHARRELNVGRSRPAIRFSFDPSRNDWPGHYNGLAASVDGAFHAMWADRRDSLQQIYSARVDVVQNPEVTPTSLRDTVVTDRVEVIASETMIDTVKQTVSFRVQLRNTSKDTIYGPLRLRLKDITTVNGVPTLAIIDADGKTTGRQPFWDFSPQTGTRPRFTPGVATEARTITLKVNKDAGLDGEFVFEVTGRLRL
jgi:hypothetical protein